eukprot:732201-Lingulodinium_polyedra.AAC.1
MSWLRAGQASGLQQALEERVLEALPSQQRRCTFNHSVASLKELRGGELGRVASRPQQHFLDGVIE